MAVLHFRQRAIPSIRPANTRRWTNVVLMLAQRLRRWPDIKATLAQCLVFAGRDGHVYTQPPDTLPLLLAGPSAPEKKQRNDSFPSGPDKSCIPFYLIRNICWLSWLLPIPRRSPRPLVSCSGLFVIPTAAGARTPTSVFVQLREMWWLRLYRETTPTPTPPPPPPRPPVFI